MSKTQILDWCDPPTPISGGNFPGPTIASERPEWMLDLMANPGVWAQVEDNILSARSCAHRLSNVKRAALNRGLQDDYEIVSRKIDSDRWGIWARYVAELGR